MFDIEPNVPTAPAEMRNGVTTPHIASATQEARRELVIHNLDAFFAGRTMPTPLVSPSPRAIMATTLSSGPDSPLECPGDGAL